MIGSVRGRVAWHRGCPTASVLPSQPVVIGTRVSDLGALLAGWVRELGFEVRLTADGVDAVSVVTRAPVTAFFLDSQLGGVGGEPVWRSLRPALGRRLVLMAWDRNNELWFEALRSGVGTVLPLPPARTMVRAALAAVGAP